MTANVMSNDVLNILKHITLDDILVEKARRSLFDFTSYTFKTYKPNWHHKLLCDYLDKLYRKEIKNLMVFMPPQHGKSEHVSIRFPAYVLGRNPDIKIAGVSYNDDSSKRFNRGTQRVIESERYRKVFPKTRLNTKNVVSDSRESYLKNAHEFEIVDHNGSYVVVGVCGPLTGRPVDLLIVDDLVKDRKDAMSLSYQLRNIEWYSAVAKTRLHNDSQILFVNTRWAEGDVPGRILKELRESNISNEFEVLCLPAIKEDDRNALDPRKIGEALWPDRHSLKKLLGEKRLNPEIFQALYQQDPSTPKELRIFSNWHEIDEMPNEFTKFYGQDFGFSNDVDALIEMEFHNGKLYIDEKLYLIPKNKNGLGTQQLIDTVKATGIGDKPIYGDSSEPRLISDMKRSGLNIKPCVKGPGSVRNGILKLQSLEVYVTKRSKNIWYEYENYQWIRGANGPINEPVDMYNHAMDAIRYGLDHIAGLGGCGIEFFEVA